MEAEIKLTPAERRALAEVIEHQELTRKSISAAFLRLCELGFVYIGESDNMFDAQYTIRSTLEGEDFLYPPT